MKICRNLRIIIKNGLVDFFTRVYVHENNFKI